MSYEPGDDGEEDAYVVVIASVEALKNPFISAFTHAKSIVQNGSMVELSVKPAIQPVTVLQFRFFHGPILTQMAEQARDEKGQRFTQDVWKRYLKGQILERTPRYDMIKMPGKSRAVPVRKWWSLKELGVRRMSNFIDESIAMAQVDYSVEFVFKTREREQVRYSKPPKSKETH